MFADDEAHKQVKAAEHVVVDAVRNCSRGGEVGLQVEDKVDVHCSKVLNLDYAPKSNKRIRKDMS